MSVPSQNEEGALHRRERVGTLSRELFPPLEKYYERNRESTRGRQFTWANTLPSGIAAPRIDSQWTLETFLPSIFSVVPFFAKGRFSDRRGVRGFIPPRVVTFYNFLFRQEFWNHCGSRFPDFWYWINVELVADNLPIVFYLFNPKYLHTTECASLSDWSDKQQNIYSKGNNPFNCVFIS